MNRKPKPPLNDLTGQKFGYMEVTRMEQTAKSYRGDWRAICKCHNCGKENVDVSQHALRRGRTTSCGCRRDQYEKLSGSNNKQFTGFGDLGGKTWGTICRRAKKRGYEVDITIEDAWALFVKQEGRCALTNLPLSVKGNKNITASLDRIDSKKGYEKDNIQWVLKPINIMKNVYSLEHFLQLCNAVAKANPR